MSITSAPESVSSGGKLAEEARTGDGIASEKRLSNASPLDAISPDGDGKAPSVRLLGSDFTSWQDKQEMTLSEVMDIPNFPDLSVSDKGRTSEPISRVQPEQEREMLDLVTREKMRELLNAPMGMERFTEWVKEEGQPGSATLLRYYKDVRAQMILMQEVKAISLGLDATYFRQSSGDAAFQGPSQCLPALSSAVLAMSTAEDEVLSRLYSREFRRFISGKIVRIPRNIADNQSEQASACLGALPDLADRGDLGEIFCLADPRQRDCPLVYVSDGFCELSEYPRSRLVGRNCRFLQGPGTDPEAVRLLREAIKAGKEHTSLLLNYSRTGRPFWNLLTMMCDFTDAKIPLRNAAGEIDYFMGAQINVNRALTSRETFEALTGMSAKGRGRSSYESTRLEISPDVLSAAEKEGQAPTVLRQIIALQPTIGYKPTSPRESPSQLGVPANPAHAQASGNKMQRWYSDLKTRRGSSAIHKGSSSESVTGSATTAAAPLEYKQQEVDTPVRDHMDNFASVYSKIIIFRATDRQITHVTPALLSYLDYPTRTATERNESVLIGMDLLSLLADTYPAITKVNRQMVAKSISERAPHSFFTGLKMLREKRTATEHDDESPDVEFTASGAPFIRGLIHLTPVKGVNDVVKNYIVVLG